MFNLIFKCLFGSNGKLSGQNTDLKPSKMVSKKVPNFNPLFELKIKRMIRRMEAIRMNLRNMVAKKIMIRGISTKINQLILYNFMS